MKAKQFILGILLISSIKAVLAQPGTVLGEQKISNTLGGLVTNLDNGDRFGEAVAQIGDLDNDGVNDLVVGVPSDDDGGIARGAVYILFMNTDGTVAAEQKISDLSGGFTATMVDNDLFGSSVAGLGDLNGDGIEDIAVGSPQDDLGGTDVGALYILFLNIDGTVSSFVKIGQASGGFGGSLISGTTPLFATSVGNIGDLDGDGIIDLIVGAPQDDDGGVNFGASWVLFMNSDGTVDNEQKISATAGGFAGPIDAADGFGFAVDGLGDLNGDGNEDIVVSERLDDDGGTSRGAVWVIFLNATGTVSSAQKISDTAGGFTGILVDSDFFGNAVSSCGDINGDGINDMVVGARGDDDGASAAGSVWILFLNTSGTVLGHQLISATSGGFTGPLIANDEWGFAATGIGDLDGDGFMDIALGERFDDDGQANSGATWVLFLDGCNVDADFTVSDLTPCEGEVVDFTNTSVNTGAFAFTWKVDGATVAVTTDYSQGFTPGGTYNVQLITSKTNCPNDTASVALVVSPNTTSSFSISACGSYTVPSGDETYLVSGTYMDTIPNLVGCDSIMTITATINANSTSSYSVSSCTNYTVPSGDETYSVSGTYMDTIPNFAGCDSIMTITVTITPEVLSSFSVSQCDSYTVPSGDETYLISGIYSDTIPSFAGCDSVMTITVNITNSTTSSFSVSQCDSYTVPSGDETYLISGIYMDTIPNFGGCDSIMTIDITVNTETSSSFSVSSCDAYTVPSGDETYSSSGTYTDTIPNLAGCDSIMTIDLTINLTTTSSFTANGCLDYTVPSGDETYTVSGVYMDTIPNVAGCDSIMTIDVTVGGVVTSIINDTACFSYTVPSGDETYSISGTYMDTIPSFGGCDSVMTINIVINTVDTSITATDTSLTANATGASYQWIDCGTMTDIPGETNALFTPAINGSYACVVTQNGCTDTSACYDITKLGVAEFGFASLNVFPNPTTGQVEVKLGQFYTSVTTRLTDLSGRTLAFRTYNGIDGLQLNIDGERGVYFLELTSDSGQTETVRIVKH